MKTTSITTNADIPAERREQLEREASEFFSREDRESIHEQAAYQKASTKRLAQGRPK
jgi:hypothetical protein